MMHEEDVKLVILITLGLAVVIALVSANNMSRRFNAIEKALDQYECADACRSTEPKEFR